MASDIKTLFERYNTLVNEVTYVQRKRREEAESVYSALQTISEEDVSALKEHVPELAVVKQYSVEDILANDHGEVTQLQLVYKKLTELLDSWLAHYEGTLC